MIRLPSPAMCVALASMLIAFGGAGYSATGGNFILGQANSATTQTKLVTPLTGAAFRVDNFSTAAGATGIGIMTATSRPPLVVNSATKVVNFNADRLDGLDSTQLPRSIVIPFNVAPGADTAPIPIPVTNRAVFVMATTFGASLGVGQVTLLRTGFDLRWTGTESYQSGPPPTGTHGASDIPGTHIVFIDHRWEVDIEVHDKNSIRIHNSQSSVARTGYVTLIW